MKAPAVPATAASGAAVPAAVVTGAAAFSEKLTAYSPEDRARILDAVLPARESCDNLQHHLDTAAILIELNLDADAICAVLLRGCLGSPETAETLKRRFGKEALLLAEDAARIAGIAAAGKTVQEADRIRKMLFAMVRDIRVILIKLADKLQTLRTLDSLPEEDRKSAAQECLDVYAPLADRLGISWIKDELEDLCLKYLNRDVYTQIKEIVALKRGERSDFLDRIRQTIAAAAEAAGLEVEVQSRAKHFYSIYRKMRKRNKEPGDLYDLFGIRILCGGIDHCYTLLGLVHRLWKPLDGRFKDYIAMPKPNGYRSLHTTVFVPPDRGEDDGNAAETAEGNMLEIQIRTRDMHRTAEYGVAGHWLYKQGRAGRPEEISLVNRMKSWKAPEEQASGTSRPAGDSGESRLVLENIRRELLGNFIYVFTPQGKVIELPEGSTPLDFAFQIHSSVGERCLLAKVDGVIAPLSSKLKNTQVVEIATSSTARPNANWLGSVKTAKARSKIRSWLQQHDETFQAAKKEEAPVKTPAKPETRQEEKHEESEKQQVVQQRGIFKVKVDDEKNMMIRFAKCCNPILGDPIVGYVSRGRGIIVHRRSCGNIRHIPDFEERKIETQWEDAGLPLKRFRIEAKYRENLFSEIEGVIRKFQGRLVEGRLDESGTNRLTGYFTMHLENREDVQQVLKHIRGIPAVSSIQTLG
ncbi:MAG: HD domain-containing protein [Treponema sp.]|nr:HD domain-containing protein [Treponema sp.]